MEREMEILKILILEDNENDLELLKEEIRASLNYELRINWVISRDDFISALRDFRPDIILSDYNLPQFNGLDALKISKNFNLDIPFIIVTGTLSEEAAADSIKSGAWDYVVKERLHRLPRAIENSLDLKSVRLKARKAEAELNLMKGQADIQLKLLWDAIDKAPGSIMVTAPDGVIQFVNKKFEQISGYKSEEVIGKNPGVLKSGKQDADFYKVLWDTILSGKEWRGEMVNRNKEGDFYWEDVSISPVIDENGNIRYFVGIKQDITEKKAAVEALKKSEQWYKAIFGNTGTAAIIIDGDGTISLVNEKFTELTGLSREEIEGKRKWMEFVTPGDLEKMLSYHKGRREPGNDSPNQYEFTFLSPRTGSRDILLTVDMIPGTDKSVASLLDLTERNQIQKELKESEEKFRLISTSAQDGIIMIDSSGKVVYWNPGAEKIFGYTFEEMKGKDLHHFIAPEKYGTSYPNPLEQFQKTGTGAVVGKVVELQSQTKNGTSIDIELSIARMQMPDGFGAVGIVRDVTDRKRAETELIQAKERAEESDRLKSAFLATMSHELRTPLNAVIGFSDLIDANMPMSEIEEMVKIINNSGKHLLRIIESIFEISMLEAKGARLRTEDFSLPEFFGSLKSYVASEQIKQQKEHLVITFKPGENFTGTRLKTDRSRLFQLISNLLNNAIKFTESGTVEYGYSISGQTVTFFVRDTGIGIPHDQKDLIYERFRQVDDTHTREYGGVGLGLSICKEIANLMDGKIWAEPDPGSGSIFYFSVNGIVVTVPEPAAVTGTLKKAYDFSGKKILVVEDEENNISFLETILKKTRATLLFAHNGKEAIQLCNDHPDLDLVLMDIKMPVMSGDVATALIKEKRKDLPVIAQTAYATSTEVGKYKQIGFDDYITKPIDREHLIEVMARYLE